MEPLPKRVRLSTEDVLEELEFDVDEPVMLGSDEEFSDEEGTSEHEEDYEEDEEEDDDNTQQQLADSVPPGNALTSSPPAWESLSCVGGSAISVSLII